MAKQSKLKVVPKEDKPSIPKDMDKEVVRLTKEYTKHVKSLGEKYGMILDVKILIEHTTNT